MIGFIFQSALLILLSLIVGYLLAWFLRHFFMSQKMAELENDNLKLAATLKRNQAALDECESRRQTLSSVKTAAPVKSESDKPAPVMAAPKVDAEDKPTFLDAPQGTADNLKKISGVGPKLEGTLNSLGVFHFWQIAAFTPDDVTRVDQYLRFTGRIGRERWIEQAKILAEGGETEFSKRSKK